MKGRPTSSFDRVRAAQAAGWVGFACVVASLCVFFVTREWGPPVWTLAGLGAAILAGAGATTFSELRRAVVRRGFQAGAQAAIFGGLGVVLFGLLNLAADHQGHRFRWDASRNQQFSLAEQTVKVVGELKKPLKVTAFFQQNSRQSQTVRDQLEEYKFLNPKRFTYDVVDPVLKPAEARRAGIKRMGTTVFEYEDNRKETSGTGEQDFTSAIINVTRPKRSIYFLTGQGELDPDDADGRQGLSKLKDALSRENYEIKKLNPLTDKQFPTDVSVLVVAGSRVEIPEKARAAIQGYLRNGGRAVVLLSPMLPRPGAAHRELLHAWGVEAGGDVVLDFGLTIAGGDPSTPAVVKFNNHEITRGLQAVVLALTRSVRPLEGRATDLSVSSLLETSANSWAERNVGSLGGRNVRFDEGSDLKGPVPVGVAVTREKSRVVVFGNSEFAANQMLDFASNADLIQNAVSWCAGEEELISIRAKTPERIRVELTNRQLYLIFLITVVLLPILVLVAGGVVWFTRR